MPLCIVLPISAKYTKPQDMAFGYQSRYTFRLQQSDGTVRDLEYFYIGLFNDQSMVIRSTGWWKGSAREIYSTPSYYNKPYMVDDAKDGAEWVAEINYPLDTHEVFGGWLSQVAIDAKGELDYSMYINYDFWKEYGAYYNLDLTVAHPEPIVLISDADGLVELDDLATSIEAVRNDGGWYDVIVFQQTSRESDLIVTLPKGAYDSGYAPSIYQYASPMENPRESRLEKNDTIGHVAYFEFKINFSDDCQTFFMKVVTEEEKAALEKVSKIHGQVVALGGGALLDPECRRIAESTGRVVFLECPDEVLLERVAGEVCRAWAAFRMLP